MEKSTYNYSTVSKNVSKSPNISSYKLNTIIINSNPEHLHYLGQFLKNKISNINVVISATDVQSTLSFLDISKIDLIVIDFTHNEYNLLAEIVVQLEDIFVKTLIFTDINDIKGLNFNKHIKILKKPISNELILEEIEQIQQSIEMVDPNEITLSIDESFNSNFLAISHLHSIDIIDKKEIVFLNSNGKYTLINLISGKTIVSSKNLGEFEKELKSKEFLRIHHSYIINLNQLNNIDKEQGWMCVMKDGSMITISRRRKMELCQRLNLKCI